MHREREREVRQTRILIGPQGAQSIKCIITKQTEAHQAAVCGETAKCEEREREQRRVRQFACTANCDKLCVPVCSMFFTTLVNHTHQLVSE